jgi:hypothetical protein
MHLRFVRASKMSLLPSSSIFRIGAGRTAMLLLATAFSCGVAAIHLEGAELVSQSPNVVPAGEAGDDAEDDSAAPSASTPDATDAEATPAAAGNSAATDNEEQQSAAPPETPSSPNDATDESETDDDETEVTDPKLNPEVIERNEILAKIDARYAPRPPEGTVEAVAPKSSNLNLAISYSLSVGFVMLLVIIVLVLKPR